MNETAENEAAEGEVDFSPGDALIVDFDDVGDAPSFEALPKGVYNCVVAECDFTYSQEKGNPMWTMQLEVLDGEYAGRILYSHQTFVGKGLPYTKANLQRIVPDLVAKPFDPEDADIIAQMLGVNLKAQVTVRKWEGNDTNNVRQLLAPDAEAFAS